jgi:hypothetical protein
VDLLVAAGRAREAERGGLSVFEAVDSPPAAVD